MAHAESHGHHIIPQSILFKVFGGLVVLTVLTVAVAQVDLGPLNIPVAIGLATLKASLVVMFFMALKYDKGVNALVFSVGSVFVVIFLVFTLFDTAYRGDIGNVDRRTIQEEAAELEAIEQQEPSPDQLRVAPADFENSGSSDGAAPSDTSGAGSASTDTTSATPNAAADSAAGD